MSHSRYSSDNQDDFWVIADRERRFKELDRLAQNTPIEVYKKNQSVKGEFPVTIKAKYKGEVFYAVMLNSEGLVSFNEQLFGSPLGALRHILRMYNDFDGWNLWNNYDKAWEFWYFYKKEINEWVVISNLRD